MEQGPEEVQAWAFCCLSAESQAVLPTKETHLSPDGQNVYWSSVTWTWFNASMADFSLQPQSPTITHIVGVDYLVWPKAPT